MLDSRARAGASRRRRPTSWVGTWIRRPAAMKNWTIIVRPCHSGPGSLEPGPPDERCVLGAPQIAADHAAWPCCQLDGNGFG